MTHREDSALARGVQQALAEGQIGAPVFVRWVAATVREAEALLPHLGWMLELAEAWLGAPAQRVYAVGGPAAGQVTALVDYAQGQGALVTAAMAPAHHPPHAHLTVLGQRGALYHEDVPASTVLHPAPPSPTAARFAAACEESLRRREAWEIGKE
jgi:hypothetical protein